MNSFVSKPIISSQTAGEQLRKAREGANLSIESVSRFLRIKPQYLEAIELGSYAELPGEIYGLAFIKRYATALRMDPRRAVELYRAERKTNEPRKQAWRTFTNPRLGRSRVQWPSRGAALAALLAVAWYAIVFSKGVLGPPGLEIASPAAYSETQDFLVTIQGSATGASAVLLNGEALPVERDGSFVESLSLAPGYHVLRITAVGRAGRETTAYRGVFVQKGAARDLVLQNNQ